MKTLKNYVLLLALIIPMITFAQIGIGTTDAKAQLDIRASNQATPANTDGLLIPKIDEFPITNPTNLQDGLLVFASGLGSVTRGFYYWNNTTGIWVIVVGNTNSITKINDLSDAKSDDDGTNDGSSVFIGIDAGQNDDTTHNQNAGIGFEALKSNIDGNFNTAYGYQSLVFNINGSANTAIGHQSLFLNTSSSNTAIGNASLISNASGNSNVVIGNSALWQNTIGNKNTAIGTRAGNDNITGSSNIFLGTNAGYNETGSNKLYIENFNADENNALIYGEFGTNSSTIGNILRINGELQLGNSLVNRYAMPIADGTVSQIMQTDGSGAVSWTDIPTSGAQKLNDLSDAKSDNDGSDDGSSVFIGVEAGLNDDATNNQNVGIGFESLNANTTGSSNTANGYRSLFNNSMGNINTANGRQSLYNNTDGDQNLAFGNVSLFKNTTGSRNTSVGNNSLYNNAISNDNTALGFNAGYNNLGNAGVFLGISAGYFETDSNKLYIENSDADADNALIYGEFGTNNSTIGNILRINGELQLGNSVVNRYAMPIADGTANQIMQTDGNGSISWKDFSTLGLQLNDLIDGKSDNDGTDNGSSVFIGVSAGLNDNSTDNKNVGIGNQSFFSNSNGYENTAIGYQSLYSNTTGFRNIANGYQSLHSNIDGDLNIAIGYQSLYSTTTANRNTAIGYRSLALTAGEENTAFGAFSGGNNTGSNNVFLGYCAGFNEIGNNKLYIANSITDANNALIYGEFDNNLFRINGDLEVKKSGRLEIITNTDASGISGTGSLEIGNSLRIDGNEIITNTGAPLFLQNDNNGDFRVDNNTLVVDASENRIGIRITSPSTNLHLKQSDNLQAGGGGITFESALANINWKIYHSGSAISFAENGVRRAYITAGTGVYVVTSDKRLKKDIVKVEPFLAKVNNLTTYRYLYKDQDNTAKKTIGFMAQEVQQIFPELVETNEDGYLGLNYAGFGVVAIKAIQEQQETIKDTKTKIEELLLSNQQLKQENEKLKTRMDKIEAMLNKK